MDVEAAKKRGPERHLTNKYNYAGPGTFFKARQKGSDFYENLMKESGRKLVGTKPYDKPINKSTAAQVQEADRVFQNCISKIKVSDGVEEKLLAVAGKAGFDAKLAAEATGVIRKGSLSDGGAKHSVLGQKVRGAVGLGKKALGGVKRGIKLT